MFLRLIILFLTPFVWGSTPKTQIWSNFNQFAQGDFQGVTLLNSGELEIGTLTKAWTRDLPSAVTALASWGKNIAYVATSGPSQIWEVTPDQKPKLVFEPKQPIVTGLFKMPNGELAIVATPKGGVTFVLPKSWTKFRSVDVPGTLFGAFLQGDSLFIAGDSNQIFKVTGTKLDRKPINPKQNKFKSIYQNYYGTAMTGTVYKDQTPILKTNGEVVALTGNGNSEVYAAINTTKNSSQLWRLSGKKSSCLVWESSSEIIYSLIYHEKKLWWGTGPGGHLFMSEPACGSKPSIMLSLQNQHRLVALTSNKSQLLVATGDTGALFELDLSQKAKSGTFISSIVKLDAPAKIQTSSGGLWLGNTPKRALDWWSFEAHPDLEAQYTQAQITLVPGKSIDKIYFTYTLPEVETRVQSVTVDQKELGLLAIHIELIPKELEPTLAYQYELESLEADRIIIQPYAKTLSVNHDRSKLPKDYYRVLVYSEKDKEHPAGESEWFEVK